METKYVRLLPTTFSLGRIVMTFAILPFCAFSRPGMPTSFASKRSHRCMPFIDRRKSKFYSNVFSSILFYSIYSFSFWLARFLTYCESNEFIRQHYSVSNISQNDNARYFTVILSKSTLQYHIKSLPTKLGRNLLVAQIGPNVCLSGWGDFVCFFAFVFVLVLFWFGLILVLPIEVLGLYWHSAFGQHESLSEYARWAIERDQRIFGVSWRDDDSVRRL
jgi:hypothetical protein